MIKKRKLRDVNGVKNVVLREIITEIQQEKGKRCFFPFWGNWNDWVNWGNWGNSW